VQLALSAVEIYPQHACCPTNKAKKEKKIASFVTGVKTNRSMLGKSWASHKFTSVLISFLAS